MPEDPISFEGEAGTDGDKGPPTPAGSGPSPDSGRKPDGDWIPRHRLTEVTTHNRTLKDQLAGYEKLGKLDDLVEKLKRADEFGKDKTFTPSETERVRKELFEAVPEFRVWNEERQLRTEHATRTAIHKIDGWLGELGVTKPKETDAEFKTKEAEFTGRATQLENILSAIIGSDPTMRSRAAVHDLTVFDDAWKDFKRAFGIGQARRQQDAKLLQMKQGGPKPPAAPAAEKPKPVEEQTEREILEEANAKALEMLGALEEA